jgi:hypothetical protein
MRHHNLCLALMIAALLSGCVDAGDPPNLQGTSGGDIGTDGALVSSDVASDTQEVNGPTDGGLAGDAGDVSSQDTGPDGEPDGTPDVTPDAPTDAPTDAPQSDSGSPECAQDGDCDGALETCQVFTCVQGLCAISHADPSDKVFCDDGIPCTTDDLCDVGGVCQGKPKDILCGDENVCTTDTCDPSDPSLVDGCIHIVVEDGSGCTDEDPCSIEDQCVGGTCEGSPNTCDDEKSCTTDSCDEQDGACLNVPLSVGTPCDGGNKCTTEDSCDGNGACVLGPVEIPADCKDDNSCTVDDCDPSLAELQGGCTMITKADADNCDDGDPCTNVAVCLDGFCQGFLGNDNDAIPSEAPFCDDGNACTLSSCEAFVGCKHVKLDAGEFCTDGDTCTDGDSCKSGVCVPGDKLQCSDPTQCLDSFCDSATGCVSEEIDQGVDCELTEVDGICSLAQCDGAGACGVFLHGATLGSSVGHYTASRALSDGGWILVGSVESNVPEPGATCAIVTRLGYDSEVVWQVTPTCDGVASPTSSAGHGVDVFPDGSFAIVGVEHTGAAEGAVEPRLWVLPADGAEVSAHELGQGGDHEQAWDVRVLDDDSLLLLLDEPLVQGAASRAVVRRYETNDSWSPGSLTSDWLFEQTQNAGVTQSIEAHRLMDVQPDQNTFGLIGSFLLSGKSIKQLIANFSLSTLPEAIPAQITYSELSDLGQIPLRASDGLYWAGAPGGGAFVAAGSAIYDDVTWSQVNILNGNGKLIGAYQIKDEHNHTVVRFGEDRLIVVAQHETAGARVHLLSLSDVTADVVETDGGLDLLDTLTFGDSSVGATLSCHAEKTCLVAGSSDGAPSWFVFHPKLSDEPPSGDEPPTIVELQSCDP